MTDGQEPRKPRDLRTLFRLRPLWVLLLILVLAILCCMSIGNSDAVDSTVRTIDDVRSRTEKLEQDRELQAARIFSLEQDVAGLKAQQEIVCAMYVESLPPSPVANAAEGPSIPKRLESFVTEAVVKGAVRDTLGMSSINPYGLNFYARRNALSDAERINPSPPTYSAEYQMWRSAILDVARRHLSSPDRLNAMYRRHRDSALAAIAEQKAGPRVRTILQSDVLPYFEKPVSDSIRAQVVVVEEALQRAQALPYDHMCRKALDAEHRQAGKDLEAMVDGDAYLVLWILRREAEGGTALVAAWRKILEDFAARLPEQE